MVVMFLFLFSLCFLLFMMLMEHKSRGPGHHRRSNFLLDLVLMAVFAVFFRLVLLMQSIGTGCGGTELTKVFEVLVVLLLFLVVDNIRALFSFLVVVEKVVMVMALLFFCHGFEGFAMG